MARFVALMVAELLSYIIQDHHLTRVSVTLNELGPSTSIINEKKIYCTGQSVGGHCFQMRLHSPCVSILCPAGIEIGSEER